MILLLNIIRPRTISQSYKIKLKTTESTSYLKPTLNFLYYLRAYEDLEAKYNLEKESLAQDVSNYKNEKRELQQALDQRDRQIDSITYTNIHD